jgi:hypothetical protein
MKLGQLANPCFDAGLAKLIKANVSIKAAYALKSTIEAYQTEFKKFQDMQKSIVEKYANKDEAGNVKLNDEQQAAFEGENATNYVKDMNELFSIEVNVPSIKQSDYENILLTTEELIAIDPLFEKAE